MTRRDDIAANLIELEQRIDAACGDAGRSRKQITLVVVTKTYPASDVDELVTFDVTDIGENRHPEAELKLDALAGPRPRLHFIGGLQTNKANAVSRYADVVQSVDRPGLVDALGRGARLAEREIGCLVQVDFGASGLGRSGIAPAQVHQLAEQVASMDGLRLDGVMTVAPLDVDPRPCFDELVRISTAIRRNHPDATVISAGMSNDFEDAIRSGATHLRVGRLILGER